MIKICKYLNNQRYIFNKIEQISVVNKFFYCDDTTNEFGSKSSKRNGIRLPSVKDKKDIWKTIAYDYEYEIEDLIPRNVDVLIIGGGVIGWSVAYFLRHYTTFSVAVVERDPSNTRCATVLGIGAIRQQFSEPENIQMSSFGAEFLRNAKEHLSILDLDPPEIQFHPHGFLTLSSEKGFEQLKSCFEVQKKLGAKVELLSKSDIKSIWPWMNTEDIGGGIHGYENEGWFDSWQLLTAFKRKACSLAAQEINGEMIGTEILYKKNFEEINDLPCNAMIRLPDGNIQPIKFSQLVISAGPWSASIGNMIGMGNKDSCGGILPLPVEPRTQHIYVVGPSNKHPYTDNDFSQNTGPGLDCPFIVDYEGLNVRRDRLGGHFLVFLDTHVLHRSREPFDQAKKRSIIIPSEKAEVGLDVDFELFESVVRPQLARRIPQMKDIQLQYGWAAPIDYNYIDQNLIIGPHPRYVNILFACGSTGHGIEHSIAIGRAIYEYILFSEYKTIDLRNFGFQRFYENELVFEKEIF